MDFLAVFEGFIVYKSTPWIIAALWNCPFILDQHFLTGMLRMRVAWIVTWLLFECPLNFWSYSPVTDPGWPLQWPLEWSIEWPLMLLSATVNNPLPATWMTLECPFRIPVQWPLTVPWMAPKWSLEKPLEHPLNGPFDCSLNVPLNEAMNPPSEVRDTIVTD
jgi:hypothetical protein